MYAILAPSTGISSLNHPLDSLIRHTTPPSPSCTNPRFPSTNAVTQLAIKSSFSFNRLATSSVAWLRLTMLPSTSDTLMKLPNLLPRIATSSGGLLALPTSSAALEGGPRILSTTISHQFCSETSVDQHAPAFFTHAPSSGGSSGLRLQVHFSRVGFSALAWSTGPPKTKNAISRYSNRISSPTPATILQGAPGKAMRSARLTFSGLTQATRAWSGVRFRVGEVRCCPTRTEPQVDRRSITFSYQQRWASRLNRTA
jgi:hypothetical protein